MRRSDLVDSPWFWSLIFSAIGLVGVWAISGKYDDRQKRLEARYEARERMAQKQGDRSTVSAEQVDGAGANGEYDADRSSPLQTGYSHKRHVPLQFLAAALLLVSLASTVMLLKHRVVARTANTTGAPHPEA